MSLRWRESVMIFFAIPTCCHLPSAWLSIVQMRVTNVVTVNGLGTAQRAAVNVNFAKNVNGLMRLNDINDGGSCIPCGNISSIVVKKSDSTDSLEVDFHELRI
ncbi:MAG: hypothetical protein HY864_01645 [Chloroflexi bacterium]|nr:hypothetical protein [Chloroflexota bacterium]